MLYSLKNHQFCLIQFLCSGGAGALRGTAGGRPPPGGAAAQRSARSQARHHLGRDQRMFFSYISLYELITTPGQEGREEEQKQELNQFG